MCIDSVMLSNHHILFHPLLLLLSIFPCISLSQWIGCSHHVTKNIGDSALVLLMNIQSWFPLELTVLISLQSKVPSGVFSSTIIPKHQFFAAQPSLWFVLTSVHDYWKNHSFDHMDLCQKGMFLLFNMLSRCVITFLPRSNCLVLSCLQSPSIVILEPKKIKSAAVSIVSPSVCHEVMELDAIIFIFWMLNFKPLFHVPLSLSSRGSLVLLRFLPEGWCHLWWKRRMKKLA